MRSSARSVFKSMMLGVALMQSPALAESPQSFGAASSPAALPERASTVRWTEELASGEGTGELVRTRDGLLFEPYAVMRRPEGLSRLTGLYTFPARTLAQPVDTIRPLLQASASPEMGVEVDVRVRTPQGAWSEWRTASAGEAARLPRAGTEVQVRLALLADEHGRGPVVREVRLEGSLEGGTSREDFQPLAALSYRIFATREGLVGGTTANGHVIKSNDRFVALPSRRALASNGGSEYQVKVCYSKTGKCTTTSVWDVGPWNTKDDYWNPSSVREMWKTLPQGKPEAQAAYQDGFNGGLDQFGRRPANPAGIDIADGAFWTDLGMSNNDWVDVTYLWTSGGSTPTGLVIDSNNANNDSTRGYLQLTGTSWASSTNVAGYFGSNYLASPTAAVSEPATFWFYLPTAATRTIDAWWTAASDRSTTAPFIVWNANGTQLATVKVNQQANGGRWNTLGTWSFPAGWNKVQLSRWTTAGSYVIADAIQVR
ncbi:hypothetical protein [Cystobacter ferrugineus]|uniref:Golvesin/Xly CBD-like domain-containing protein n=1 Tax=Cystobacter ferrugineus TaxID=83449 RepID=A0A1L9BBJ0_9BACT|nr:hypothetical protein [Cystobacter ferrugineus]OJH39609.1 hypothetical protein BON30_19170 [Cystobacter ferrugineus]